MLGEAYLRKTNPAKAEEAYLLAVSLQTNNVDAILGLARVAQVKGDTKAELLYLSQANELAGSTPDLHYRVGTTALQLGVFDEAQSALRALGADVHLLSIVDSWQDTLPDEDILQLLKNWNAGRPLFQTIYFSAPQVDE